MFSCPQRTQTTCTSENGNFQALKSSGHEVTSTVSVKFDLLGRGYAQVRIELYFGFVCMNSPQSDGYVSYGLLIVLLNYLLGFDIFNLIN